MWVRWIVAIISFASGCTPGNAAMQEMSLDERVEERVEEWQPHHESPSSCLPAAGVHAIGRLALIELAAERLGDPACGDATAVGGSLATGCQAIWLASVLDPIVLWTEEMAVEDRRRAAQVVDRAFALVELDPSASETREALEDLRATNAAISSLLNTSHETTGELEEARLVSLVVARSDAAVIEPLRALERACNERP